MKCQHCTIRQATCGRGLCRPCHSDPAIFGLYESREYREPTEAELDALIEANYPTMPAGNEGEEPVTRYREIKTVAIRSRHIVRKRI
jgi:hypothetical protein